MMTNIYIVFLSVLCLIGFQNQGHAQVDRVLTYNIKYDNPKDSVNNWTNRKEEVIQLIKHYEPQIFGIQEGLLHQLQDLDSGLPNYARIGVGRDDGIEKGEFSAIYYRGDEFIVESESTFWLSETSDIVSMGWDASYKRVCTYGLFKNKLTDQKFLVFNVHYDHKGKIARAKSSELILDKIKKINTHNYPVILMGDFNAQEDDLPIRTITQDLDDGSKLCTNGIYGPTGTFTGFVPNAVPDRRIDFIFVKDFEVTKYSHIDDKKRDNNYLSDHLPVLIEFKNR